MARVTRLPALLCVLLAWSAPVRAQTAAQAAPMARPPAIDGAIGQEEWRGAISFSGLQFGDRLDPRQGRVLFGCDTRNVYVAFRTEMPPDRKLATRIKRRGDQVVGDDSLELWFAPPARDGRDADGRRGQGYFQLIVNSTGVVFDRHYEPGFGLPARDWNVRMEMKSRFTADGFWEAEIAVPLEELGMRKLVLPSVWRFNAVRNWKSPSNQANITPSVAFTDLKTMAEITVAADAPVVGVSSIGEPDAGRSSIAISLFNPGGRRRAVAVETLLRKGAEPPLADRRTVPLDAGKDAAFVFAPEFQPGPANTLSVTATDAETGSVLYRRAFSFGPAPAHKWTMAEEFLTFSLPFEGTLTAAKSGGRADPLKSSGAFSFVEGFKGKALRLEKDATVFYERAGNLTVPGAVSFRVKFFRDRIPNPQKSPPFNYTYLWFTEFKNSGYVGIQDSVYGNLNFWAHYFPGIAGKDVQGSLPWEKDRWYHVLANLHERKVELYLDGRFLAQATLERPWKAEEFSPFRFGSGGDQRFAVDEAAFFSRTLERSEIERLALGEESVDGKIGWFPSLRSVSVEAVMDAAQSAESDFRLVVLEADESRTHLSRPIADDERRPTAAGTVQIRATVPLPKLPDGTYAAWLEQTPRGGGAKRRLLRRTIVLRTYEWEKNTLGMSDAIIPPFTPLAVSGDAVSCVLRTHRLGGLGLWRQVESLGQPLLARPVALAAVSGGKPVAWRHGGVRFIETKKHRVRFEARSSSAAMNASAEGEFDYDGLMLTTVTVAPAAKGVSCDRLALEIPVRKEIATLFHACGEHLRSNPGGAIPAGTGVVWESRTIPQPHIDNFIPYIWVGGEERGVAWIADWDRDWVHGKDRAAVELLREPDGTAVIRVNLLNGPLALDRPRSFTFALQASPVKPMARDWRDRIFDLDSPGTGRFTILWPASWGGHYGWASRYPLDEDFTLIRKIAETKRTGVIDNAYIASWVKQVAAHPGPLSGNSQATVDSHVRFSFSVAQNCFKMGPPTRLTYYSCACEGTGLLPEDTVYRDEWSGGAAMHSSASFRDYAVWYADKMMEAGMEGIYVDNAFPSARFTWQTGEAYIDDNGDVRPGLGVLTRLRPLIRRLAVMMHEKGREPWVRVHMTNANLLPVLSFAQSNLDWEWKYGGADYQDRMTPDYVRAVSIGRQAGTIPNVLGGTHGIDEKSPEYLRVCRTGFALTLPHEMFFYSAIHTGTAARAREVITGFRAGGGVEAYPYWEAGGIVRADGRLLTTVYRKGNRLLFVVGNMGDGGVFPIRLDLKRLRLGPVAEAVDRETGAKLATGPETVTLEIKKRDFALVEAVCEPAGGR